MKCPVCGNSEMVTKTVNETLFLEGQSLTLHDMRGEFCESCGEGVWDETSYHRYIEGQTALVRSVRGNVGSDIRRIRKKLKLTQQDIAKLFGIGKVAFSRYERGETRPPAPLVKLLRIVEKHPDLIDEIQGFSA